MRELIPTIVAMNVAADKARSSVDEHLSKLIDEVLHNLDEQGFPYGDALDLITEHALFQQCSCHGRNRAEFRIQSKLKQLMMNDDFAS